jgi:hypothetical protein
MDLSKELVLELQQIIKEEYGRDVTYEDAYEIGSGMVGYFDLLAKLNYRIKQGKYKKSDRSQ